MCAPGHSFELNPFYPIGFEHCSTGCPEKTAERRDRRTCRAQGIGTQLLECVFASDPADRTVLTFEESGLVCNFQVNLSGSNVAQAFCCSSEY